jgi:hypothetical protein
MEMTSPSDPHQAWRRLADLLIQRRVDIDADYRNRKTFCAERGVDYRVISDLEGARRTNFSRPVVAQIENAYALAAGNLQRILAGGDVEPLGGVADTRPPRAPAASPGLRIVDYDDSRFALEVEVDTSVSMDEALAALGDLTQNERILVANLRAMDHPPYPPSAVAGAVLLLRSYQARQHAPGETRRPRKGA